MPPGVCVVDTPHKGRCVRAEQDFAVGQCVLTDTPLFVISETHCNACLQPHCALQCPTFQATYQPLLGLFQDYEALAEKFDIDDILVLYALKFVGQVMAGILDAKSVLGHFFNPLRLVHRDVIGHFYEFADHVLEQVDGSVPLDGEDIVSAIGIYSCNSHRIPSLDGGGLYPKAAMLEHSCRYNAQGTIYEGLEIRYHAAEPIAAGEAITISYVPCYLSTAQRNAALEKYFFQCHCAICTTEPDLVRAFQCPACGDGTLCPRGWGHDVADWVCLNCQQCCTTAQREAMLQAEAAADSVDPFSLPVTATAADGVLRARHYALYRALDSQIADLAASGRAQCLNEALGALLKALEETQQQYHPQKATVLELMGQLQNAIGNAEAAAEAYGRAYSIRVVCNGADANETRKAFRLSSLRSACKE
uniref:SET domain-containing protein n=1 Tax=Eutreptiella gymnastica TaxID=73025 RepID=A0A7S4CVD1_9EUGL